MSGDASTGRTAGAEVCVATVLALLGADAATPREDVLRTAREGRHKLAATLLSLWAARGDRLTGAAQTELVQNRERIDHYRDVWAELQDVAPDAYLLKGMTIAALYPPGVLRAAGDLDVICHDPGDLWACARRLAETGWELAALTVGPARGGQGTPLYLGAEFRSPAPEGSPDPYAVGLATAEIVTDIRGPAWQLARPGFSVPAACALALVAERWERPFRSRDFLDMALLLRHLDDDGLRQLRDDLDRTGLWPEWRAAMRGTGRLGGPPVAGLPRTRIAAGRARLTRAVRTAVRWSSPARVAAFVAQSGVEGEGGRLADAASDLVHRRIGARLLLRRGVPLFGVPLDGVPADGLRLDGVSADGLRLDDVGTHLVARTPLGSFLLVSGAARQEWLDEVSAEGVA
ncbi:hypothetical protein [Streptomyces sp. NBC_01304]|uniref:hypothetical protein n=1 Tax=Streptomyces sp. NBC_01304 TaxID=2903818 RepID=UPI002E0E2FA7|nr:nucleotidyltransferase family protein [Streptomyces sp. NBC_01304]